MHRNPVIPDVTTAAAGVYSVRAIVDGCSSDAAATAVTVNFVPAPIASSNGPICAGKTLQLTATTVPGATYRWTGPNGFQSTEQNPKIESVTSAAAGSYTVTAIAESCESLPATTSVTVRPIPSAAISTAAALCPGRTGYAASVAPNQYGYVWTIVNGVITGGAGTNAITFQAGTSGPVTLTVEVAGPFGCSAQSLLDIPVVGCFAEPAGMSVDGSPALGLSDGNGVIEPGETAVISPSWKNVGNAPMQLSGTVSAFTGPSGAVYTIGDAAADFGSIPPAGTGACTGTGNCYSLVVSNPATRPAPHWDAVFNEALSNGDPPTPRPLHVGKSFLDVAKSHVFYTAIETLFHSGITVGCTPTTYCPDSFVSRLQMSVFVARARAGGDGKIPASGTAQGKSYNCSSFGNSLFSDVDRADPFCRHVHYIYGTGVTTGCEPGKYCPNPNVTRAQMAMFIARAMAGSDASVPETYGPDPKTGRSYSCSVSTPKLHFTDVSVGDLFCRHTHYLWARDVISGFLDGSYSGGQNVTRGAMAKFLVNGFGLGLYGP